jgi:high affinity Mn2+ porin
MISLSGYRQAVEPAVMVRGNATRAGGIGATKRRRRLLERALAGAAFGALTLGGPAIAADLPLKAPQLRPAFDWSGFYVGGHLGYSRGHADVDVTAPGLTGFNKPLGSMFAGVQAGYNHFLASGLMLGAEGDLTFPNFLNADDTAWSRTTAQGDLFERIDYIGRVRGRIGYAFNPFLLYATGGFAWSQARFVEIADLSGFEDKTLRIRTGFTVGAGVEVPIAPDWSARLEYLYDNFGRTSFTLPTGARGDTAFDLHTVRLGLNWHLPQSGALTRSAASFAQPVIDPERWNVHGQYTFIGQGYPSFRSPYQGANSLAGSKQAQNTQSATAYVGVRLWEGAEFYINPELMQGFGLSDVHGLAGFSNGEAQKSSFPSPRLNVARAFVRQTFGLGGEQEVINDSANQLGGKQDINRITVTAGKFAVTDAFNGNVYANDPRTTFLNWNIYGGGSYDWTMDKLSWTWGAFVDFNQKNWAFRTGYFLLPTTSNANSFDTRAPERGQYTAELELRYQLFEQPGKLRLFGWVNNGTMGGFTDALALPLNSPNYPDIALTRRTRTNYGIVANFEQAITADLGLFSRATWSPGKTEFVGWTDCTESLSFGTVLMGSSWGRPNDRIGVAGVIEGLSSEARAYFEAGGLGILIGDGQLNYRREKILEAYYAYSLNKWATVTFDYQFIANPGYNADRGPVSVFSARLHAEF